MAAPGTAAQQAPLPMAAPGTAAQQAPLPMGLSRQEPWSGLPGPSQGAFLTQGSSLGLLHCRPALCHLSRCWKGRLKTCTVLVLLLRYVE